MEHKPERLLKLGRVLDRTGIGRASLYRKMGDGDFPQSIKIGERAVAWRETEIDAWIADRIESSRGSA